MSLREKIAQQRESLKEVGRSFDVYRQNEMSSRLWHGFWLLVAKKDNGSSNSSSGSSSASSSVRDSKHALNAAAAPMVFLAQRIDTSTAGASFLSGHMFDGERVIDMDDIKLTDSRRVATGAALRDRATGKFITPCSLSLGFGGLSAAVWFEWKARGPSASTSAMIVKPDADDPDFVREKPDAILVRAVPRLVCVAVSNDDDNCSKADAVCSAMLDSMPNHFRHVTCAVSVAGQAPFQSVKWDASCTGVDAVTAIVDGRRSVAHGRNASSGGLAWAVDASRLHRDTTTDQRYFVMPANTQTLVHVRALKYPAVLCHADVDATHGQGSAMLRILALREANRQFELGVADDAFPTLTGPALSTADAAESLFVGLQELQVALKKQGLKE